MSVPSCICNACLRASAKIFIYSQMVQTISSLMVSWYFSHGNSLGLGCPLFHHQQHFWLILTYLWLVVWAIFFFFSHMCYNPMALTLMDCSVGVALKIRYTLQKMIAIFTVQFQLQAFVACRPPPSLSTCFLSSSLAPSVKAKLPNRICCKKCAFDCGWIWI